MANLPGSVTYGRVVGQFIQAVADSADPGSEPDALPVKGTLTFTPTATQVPLPNASPNPLTMFQTVIPASLDAEGYVVDAQGNRGVTLISGDSPSALQGPFTYTVSMTFEGVNAASFSFFLPANAVIDLTTAIPVPPDPSADIAPWIAAIQYTVTQGTVDGSGNLILQRTDGTTFNAGNVMGLQGPPGDLTPATPMLEIANGATIALQLGNLPSTRNYRLAGAATVTLPSTNPPADESGTITMTFTATAGVNTLTFPAMRWGGKAPAPTMSMTPGDMLIVHFFWTGIEWVGALMGQF